MSEYLDILHRLWSLHHSPTLKPMDLVTTVALNEALGSPDRHYPVVHVAGSNGKGSVVAKMSAALQASGYRVGIYTSPHLSCFRERIQINGEMISEQAITDGLQAAFEACERLGHAPSFFELTTCVALKYFADQKVDIAVLEVGLGGRLDSTNIVNPILSVITSISLEHTQILGHSREIIALEKGGIIKTATPVVVGVNADLPCLRQQAATKGSQYVVASGTFESYDQENSATAYSALTLLKEKFHITKESMAYGLAQRPHCRIEFVSPHALRGLDSVYHAKGVILDVAHNPDGIERLISSLRHCYPGEDFCVVCGFSKEKEVVSCLRLLGVAFSHLYLVSAAHERAMPIEELAQQAGTAGISHTAHSTVTCGILAGLQQAKEKGNIVLVCGSFFIMSEVRAAMGIFQPQDPVDLNEPRLPCIGC